MMNLKDAKNNLIPKMKMKEVEDNLILKILEFATINKQKKMKMKEKRVFFQTK